MFLCWKRCLGVRVFTCLGLVGRAVSGFGFRVFGEMTVWMYDCMAGIGRPEF